MSEEKDFQESQIELIEDISEQVMSAGEILREQREKEGLSVEQVADRLNLSTQQITAIEQQQHDELPESTYVRGYLRAYARLLTVDEATVLDAYHPPSLNDSSSLDNLVDSQEYDASEGSPVAKVLLVLTLLLLIGVVYWGYQYLTKEKLSDANSTQAPVQAEVQPPQPGVSQASESNETGQGANALAKNRLQIVFAQTSWVDIRDLSDQRLAYRSYAQGEQLDVESETPLRIYIAEAAGAKVTYNGESYDISPHINGDYAEFQLGEE